MATVMRYTVVPKLPDRVAKLADIANNMWWCWDPDAIELFLRIDRHKMWVAMHQNPKRMLGEVSQIRFEELVRDESFLAHFDRVVRKLEDYMRGSRWAEKHPAAPEGFEIAYFSAEYGIHECLTVYSGGLGVLAGDHLKASSDLGIPLVAIGLLYRSGYFRQYLNADGWQQEEYPRNDFYNMPIELVYDADGAPLHVEVPYPGRTVKGRVWQCHVGRVPLYLLDTDYEENTPEDRRITGELYGGDRDTRIRQEIMLGMGGVMALHKLGHRPTCFHMNEGHSAFMTLQRIKELVQFEGQQFHEALETIKAGSFFTTHTPVPAGNDMFDPQMVEYYFSKYCEEVGITTDQLLALGRQNPADKREPFCMTVLAIKLSAGANGVSRLHGEVARNMWRNTWKGIPENEIPITHITNGIHTRFWISRDLADLYDRYLGPGWINSPDDQSIWEHIDEVPDTELWRTHERRRERLVTFARRRLHTQLTNRGAPSTELRLAMEVLDPESLTIGFARRFATYKRATLILRDAERLRRILLHADTPVQFIIAGKAHPADHQAKHLIRDLVHFARDPDIRMHFVFIENYDINVARYLVQGVDCWLNTPRRPMEASGTSGMKAAANGALNISVPDGWWCEAAIPGVNGWNIGLGETYDTIEEQDNVESQALYEILEQEVVPTFYDRGRDGLPREWIARMKAAIRTISPVFNTHRMVQEYTDRFYLPCSTRRSEFKQDNRLRARTLAAWKQLMHKHWPKVAVRNVQCGDRDRLPCGAQLPVSAEVVLEGLTPDDVTVEIYYGDLDPEGQVTLGRAVEMACTGPAGKDVYRFEGAVVCEKTGQQGFTVRAIPNHSDLAEKHETALIVWA
ncbi:MAG: alpha-glucan family phosphorylase [Candidatus Hydrogenedentes bacterium]|nr:alpha-glucan family phosphorylase [Candidatus Hydrogenedentota bacterium]